MLGMWLKLCYIYRSVSGNCHLFSVESSNLWRQYVTPFIYIFDFFHQLFIVLVYRSYQLSRLRISKESTCQWGDTGDLGLIPGSVRSLGVGNGNALQYSCLENSMDREAWLATVHGVTKNWTRLSNWAYKKKSPVSQDYMSWEPGWKVISGYMCWIHRLGQKLNLPHVLLQDRNRITMATSDFMTHYLRKSQT